MLSGVYRFPAMDSVIFGKPFVEALAQEVDRVEARAVFISSPAARSLAPPTRSIGCAKCWATALPAFARRSAPIRRAPTSSLRQTQRKRPGPI